MFKLSVLLIFSFLLFSCSENDKINSENQSKSKNIHEESENSPCNSPVINHSYSNIDEINTSHLHLDFKVDFEKQIITGIASHTMNNSGVEKAIFDIEGLKIDKVTIGKGDNEKETDFKIGTIEKYIGAPLEVAIEKTTNHINIYYETTENSIALDWLSPELTESKKHPFLYTQGQAILTRSWIPVQDNPSNRITYSAKVEVPKDLLALMSANNPTTKNKSGIYEFEMNQPIPSYLIAMAVGELSYRQLGERSGVYAEPGLISDVEKEFEDIPKMIKAAQELYGEYLWDKYDVIVLPYSFPFGGMENPRLTFATPTLITGDKSLVSVIAHELAHSWSGNLVTNATWDDLWLNEGFTVYFENRIMEKLYGKEVADMLMLIEFQELKETIQQMREDGIPEDSNLKLNLTCRNPDDGLTDIAYVKGALFLKTLESELGREKMDEFLTNYFSENAFKSMSTEDFVSYYNEHIAQKYGFEFNINEWIYESGIPDNHIKISSPRFEFIQNLAKEIKNGNKTNLPDELQRSDYTTQEWLAFIRTFGKNLDPKIMKSIDKQLGFSKSGNAEIQTEWFVLAINSDYNYVKPEVEKLLLKVGRRKFLKPIYSVLAESPENKAWAKEIYKKARPNYHAVSYKTIDEILNW